MIDLNKLRHAVAVAREGSFTAAAAAIHITQPALTRSIRALEAQYGLKLFERGRAGTKLTLIGTEFIGIADEIIRRASSVDEQLQLVGQGRAPTVRFGIGSVSAASFLPGILPDIADQDVHLHIRIAGHSALELLLRHGEIDFFLGAMGPDESFNAAANGFEVVELPGVEVALLTRIGHPLLEGELTPARLSRYPVAAGTFVRDAVSPLALNRLGLRTPSVELDDYGILAALVRATDHIMISSDILPEVRPELGLALLPIRISPDDLPRSALVSSIKAPLPEASRRIAATLAERVALLAARTARRSDRQSEPV